MLISLHKQATTTPKVRALIQASTEPAWVLAERHGTTPQTIWKWRKRSTVHDRSHTPHHLQTTLSPAQEAVAVVLRRSLLLSLDDLLAVVREFLNPDVSRSGLDPSPSGLNRWRPMARPAQAWGRQSEGASGAAPEAHAQAVQSLRAGVSACRCEVSASNG